VVSNDSHYSNRRASIPNALMFRAETSRHGEIYFDNLSADEALTIRLDNLQNLHWRKMFRRFFDACTCSLMTKSTRASQGGLCGEAGGREISDKNFRRM
jgi:hypothetical protein